MPGKLPRPTPAYRLVHEDNLAACLERGALHAPNHTPDDAFVYRTIHRLDIQQGRRARTLPRGPGATAHDYVGFYLGPRSVMLYQLKTGWVPGYTDGQEPLVHLVTTCQRVAEEGLAYIFSDGHGLARFTTWYDDLADLKKLDWATIYAKWWNDTPEDMDKQRRKQSEFLVHESVPWELLTEIGVLNDAARARVGDLLETYGSEVPVRVRSTWYY